MKHSYILITLLLLPSPIASTAEQSLSYHYSDRIKSNSDIYVEAYTDIQYYGTNPGYNHTSRLTYHIVVINDLTSMNDLFANKSEFLELYVNDVKLSGLWHPDDWYTSDNSAIIYPIMTNDGILILHDLEKKYPKVYRTENDVFFSEEYNSTSNMNELIVSQRDLHTGLLLNYTVIKTEYDSIKRSNIIYSYYRSLILLNTTIVLGPQELTSTSAQSSSAPMGTSTSTRLNSIINSTSENLVNPVTGVFLALIIVVFFIRRSDRVINSISF